MTFWDIFRIFFRIALILLTIKFCGHGVEAREIMTSQAMTGGMTNSQMENNAAIKDQGPRTRSRTAGAAWRNKLGDPSVWRQRNTNAAGTTGARKRTKRDGGGCCGGGGGGGCCCGNSGSSERRRRRRNRKRTRSRYLAHSVLRFITTNGTIESMNSTRSPQHRLENTQNPLTPFLRNWNRRECANKIESAEIIIISPSHANDDVESSDSYETSAESFVIPYMGTYGTKKAPPGASCQTKDDCVVGAVCKQVANVGRCVCELPLVNLGDKCMPRSAAVH